MVTLRDKAVTPPTRDDGLLTAQVHRHTTKKENPSMEHTAIRIELDAEQAQLLPEREALSLFNWANVVANNTTLALNAVTLGGTATATGIQTIGVFQG
jgi:hypothetical protein